MALSFHGSFGTPVTIIRPFNTYGPRQSARAVIPTIITQLLGGAKSVRLGALHPTRDLPSCATRRAASSRRSMPTDADRRRGHQSRQRLRDLDRRSRRARSPASSARRSTSSRTTSACGRPRARSSASGPTIPRRRACSTGGRSMAASRACAAACARRSNGFAARESRRLQDARLRPLMAQLQQQTRLRRRPHRRRAASGAAGGHRRWRRCTSRFCRQRVALPQGMPRHALSSRRSAASSTRFEAQIAELTGTSHAIAVVNGTAALHICLLLAGVAPATRCWRRRSPSSPPPTRSAIAARCRISSTAIRRRSASIRTALAAYLRDIARRSGPDLVNRDTGRRIRAVMPMHTFGHPVDMEPLLALADALGIVGDRGRRRGARLAATRAARPAARAGSPRSASTATRSSPPAAAARSSPTTRHWRRRAKHLTTTAKLPHPGRSCTTRSASTTACRT